jgi:polar amino acid transport system substrate-binding protein
VTFLRLAALAPCAAVVLLAAPVHADDWATAKAAHKLEWGGDIEGGGPYMYPDENDPEKLVGFEIDLMAAVGKFLGVEPVFQQSQWDRLPDMLRSKKVAVITNGLEYTPERLDVMDATVPYYVYGLQLLCPKRADGCKNWDDLLRPKGDRKQTIGVLTGSAAETEARRFCGAAAERQGEEPACEVVNYDGNTDSMREVETGKLDATVQDTPIAAFYAPRFPQLQAVGKPVAGGYYVMYVRKGEAALLHKLNEAIVVLMRTGELERVCAKYGIWDAQQHELAAILDHGKFYGLHQAVSASDVTPTDNAGATAAAADASATTAAAPPPQKPPTTVETVELGTRQRGWAVVQKYTPILAQSALMTVILAVLSFPLAILLGLLVAVGRLYGPGWLRWPLAAYVEFLRGTPLMLQLYFLFFFLPELGVNLGAFTTGIIGLAVNYSAYESEIYRAGLQAVPPGQMEAAQSLGMSRALALRRIVVPQAVRMVIPPVVSDFIALFKDTSVCSVVTIVELTKRFTVLSMSTQATVELMIVTAVLYLLMSYPLSVAARRIEAKLGVGAHLA